MNNLLFSLTNFIDNLNSSLGIWYQIILNAFGVIAIICKIIEYQVKKRSTMYTMVLIASICWVFYFIFLANLLSALTCALGVLKFLVFMRREKSKWARSILWLYFFLLLQAGVVTYSIITSFSWLDVFVILAGFVGVFTYFVTNPKWYRILSFFHMSLWVINSSIYFYPIALISDSFSTVSCGVAIYRFDIRKNKSHNTTNDK